MKHFTGAILVVIIVFIVSFVVSLSNHERQRGESPFLMGTPPFVSSASAQSAILLGQKINVNSATKEDFEALPGIGPSLAERIIKYRTQHGRFKSIDEMDNISGIGPKTVEKLREFLSY